VERTGHLGLCLAHLAHTHWQFVNRLLYYQGDKRRESEIRMMYPYHVLMFAIWQSLCMLITLAGFVFLLVVAWRFMKAHEALASAFKDASLRLIPKE
jgi:hypothetical protein